MERRIFIAVILGALVMYGWQALFMPPPPATPARTGTEAPAATKPTPAGPSAPSATAAAPAPPDAPAAVAPVKGESSEREIVVETAAAEIVLTNRGARVLHWRLKD